MEYKKVFTREETKNLSLEQIEKLREEEDTAGLEIRDGRLHVLKLKKRTAEEEAKAIWFENYIDEHVKIFQNELNTLGYGYDCKSKEAYQKDKMTIPACVENFREACALIVDYRFKISSLEEQLSVYREFCHSITLGNIKNIEQQALEVMPRSIAMRIAYDKPRWELEYQYPNDLWEDVLSRNHHK